MEAILFAVGNCVEGPGDDEGGVIGAKDVEHSDAKVDGLRPLAISVLDASQNIMDNSQRFIIK